MVRTRRARYTSPRSIGFCAIWDCISSSSSSISHGKHLQNQRLKHVVASRTACARVLAPTRANVETDSNNWDELLLRASAGVRTRHCTVRTRRARYLRANTYRLRGSSTSSLPAPPASECWRRLEPTSKRTATTGMSFSCAPALMSERGIAWSEQGVHDISRQTFSDSEAQVHSIIKVSSLRAPPARERWRQLEPTPNER